jgi:hypothetical protein
MDKLEWSLVHTTGKRPSPIDSHEATVYKNKMLVFAGFTNNEYSGDVHELDLETFEWVVKFDASK